MIPVDFPGEFIIAPFRYYQDTEFTGVFDLFDEQRTGHQDGTVARGVSANDDANVETGSSTPPMASAGPTSKRSVATTCWTLRINAGQVDISKLKDIEIILQHQSYTRPQITCPPLNN
ncbi:MAG: hypothetical protein R3F11_28810 [Verrucomicrobiales bacterium]